MPTNTVPRLRRLRIDRHGRDRPCAEALEREVEDGHPTYKVPPTSLTLHILHMVLRPRSEGRSPRDLVSSPRHEASSCFYSNEEGKGLHGVSAKAARLVDWHCNYFAVKP